MPYRRVFLPTMVQTTHAPRWDTVIRFAGRVTITMAFSVFLSLIAVTRVSAEEFRGPDVVIIKGKDRVVYEFRQNGELRMVRIVPKWGKPYYLVPRDGTRGFGNLERADMLLPKWVIAEF